MGTNQLDKATPSTPTMPRPMFASTADSIHAHLTIVFAALAISRHLYAITVHRWIEA